ncbi:MAG TPA: DNA topoisomerase IB [Blastocatellia bacterium]|nr:DNA topoisomerase IB [Blastocatellia bacterium]
MTTRDPERAPDTDPVAVAREAAKSAGLRYVNDTSPGILRRRAGKGFSYIGVDGKPLRDADELARIRALAIPPAWTGVWICPSPHGHIQATGRDAKGRKQYRYHARWRAVRDETKYDRMIAFGHALPRIRERTESDLVLPGLPREKVLATVVRLLERTLIRVGNEEYARANRSFGLTTLRDQHVRVKGSTLRFEFRGKSGVRHTIDLNDRRLARIVRRCQELPGQELFQYLDEAGEPQSIGSAEVNDYLREITGEDFTAKDFRTWAGTVFAALALQESEDFDSEAEAKRNVVRAIESVAARLGNTVAVCRKSYVHPVVIELYTEGTLCESLEQCLKQQQEDAPEWLQPEEASVLALLEGQVRREADQIKAA